MQGRSYLVETQRVESETAFSVCTVEMYNPVSLGSRSSAILQGCWRHNVFFFSKSRLIKTFDIFIFMLCQNVCS